MYWPPCVAAPSITSPVAVLPELIVLSAAASVKAPSQYCCFLLELRGCRHYMSKTVSSALRNTNDKILVSGLL